MTGSGSKVHQFALAKFESIVAKAIALKAARIERKQLSQRYSSKHSIFNSNKTKG